MTFSTYRNIVIYEFKRDILESPTLQLLDGPIDELVEPYYTGLQQILDKHAPTQTKEMTTRPNSQWYFDSLYDVKQQKRKAERLLQMTRSSRLN